MPDPVFEILGIEEMRANLRRIAQEVPNVVAKALYEEAKIEMKEAKKRTPVSEKGSDGLPPGTLRDSGTVYKWDGNVDNISVRMTFGVPIPYYAIYVHENLEAEHKIGEAKFLENTLLESAPFMGKRIAARINFDRWGTK